ncbi:MAG: hypothetical protein ACREIA_14210 [Opitutaceae bacterium]
MKLGIQLIILLCGGALSVFAGAPAATANLSRLELAGFLTLGDEVQVCVSDHQTGQSAWLIVGEQTSGVWAAHFDPKAESVVLRMGEEMRTLQLREARVRNLPVARLPDGSVDWFHMNLSDKEKEHVADLMMWDILEVGRLARLGRRSSDGRPASR